MISSRLALLLASLTLQVPISSQGSAYLPDANAATGLVSINPFGGTNPADPATANQAISFRIPTASLPAVPTKISALGFAAAGNRLQHFGRISIRLGQTTNPTLNPILFLNMTGFTAIVMQASDWQWQTTADQWSFIGLSSSYPYDPANGDLVVEIAVSGASSTGSGPVGFHSDPSRPSVLQTAWRFQIGRGIVGTGAPKIRVGWDANELQVFGGGCVGSNGLAPRLVLTGSSALGGQMNIGLRDVPATTSFTILMLDPRLRGTPVDLTGFGAPTCAAATFFTLNQAFAVQGGALDLPVTVPNTVGLVGQRLWVQWLPLDLSANALGLTVSNFGRIMLGH